MPKNSPLSLDNIFQIFLKSIDFFSLKRYYIIKIYIDVIDAKSIMGIFSLDISKPIDLNIHNADNLDEIMEQLQPYLVTE